MKFENVKTAESLILIVHGRLGGDEYYKVKVTHVTKTRFKTTNPWKTEHSKPDMEWNKDGSQFPKETGWNRSYYKLEFLEPEVMKRFQASIAKRKFLNAFNKIKKIDAFKLVEQINQKELEKLTPQLEELASVLEDIESLDGKEETTIY